MKTDKGKIIYVINGENYTEQELKNQNIKNITTDGSILYLTNEKSDDKTIIFKRNSVAKDKSSKTVAVEKKIITDDVKIKLKKYIEEIENDKKEIEESKIAIEKTKEELEKLKSEIRNKK